MRAVRDQLSCENPIVSVVMITYNHERFIAQAVESVLMQETDFPVELVIGEDCSTDGTREVVSRLARENPGVIRPVLQGRNVGAVSNTDAVLKACRGEYIAMLEGDDYWTDPLKLRRQVEALDRDPGASLCFHLSGVLDDRTGAQGGTLPEEKYRSSDLTAEDMLYSHMIPSNTKMWRRSCLPHFRRTSAVRQLDRAMDVILALQGRVLFLDKTMSVYRLHSGGIWTGAGQLQRNLGLYQCLNYLHQNVPDSFKPKVLDVLIGVQTEVIKGQRRERDPRLVLTIGSYVRNLIRQRNPNPVRHLGWLLGILRHGPGAN
jgi:glycosyltransferase involved in cell wall biosynthesis